MTAKPKAFLLGLQSRFVPFVKDGSKAHTIRGERKDGMRPQPGDMITIYTGLRTKACEFVLRAPCIRTEDVEINSCEASTFELSESYRKIDVWLQPNVWVAGERLSMSECDALAWRDGFRFDAENRDERLPKEAACFSLMMDFWDGRLPFHGWITHWDYSKAEFERVPVGTRDVELIHMAADLAKGMSNAIAALRRS